MNRSSGTKRQKSPKKAFMLNATCVNIMARFIRIARQESDYTIHLQDQDVLSKIRLIAKDSQHPQLIRLHQTLETAIKQHMQSSSKPEIGATEPADIKGSFMSKSKAFFKNIRPN